MTQLELVAETGSEAIRIAWVYLKGQLTLRGLENILREKRAGLTHRYANEYMKECIT